MARALTLLEVLVVVALLATVSGGLVVSLGSNLDASYARLASVERAELERALRQFVADTGDLPLRGAFALVGDGGAVPLPAGAPADYAARVYAPGNWEQLLSGQSPLAGTGHALEHWNPDTRRGWRGPYLARVPDGWIHAPDDVVAPASTTLPVRGVAGPWPSGYAWYLHLDDFAAGRRLGERGAPYVHNFGTTDPGWFRDAGPNGVHEGGANDDLTVALE